MAQDETTALCSCRWSPLGYIDFVTQGSCCRPDGEITFDMATSLHRSGTDHDHDQPAHLRLKSSGAVETVNARIYDGPETRYCPAGELQAAQAIVSMCPNGGCLNAAYWNAFGTVMYAASEFDIALCRGL